MQAIHVVTEQRPDVGMHLVYGTDPRLRPRSEPAARALALLNIGAQVPVTPDHCTADGVRFYVTAAEAERIRRLRVMPFIYCFDMAEVSLVIPVGEDGAYSVRTHLGAGRFWAARDDALALAAARDQMVSFRTPCLIALQRGPWR